MFCVLCASGGCVWEQTDPEAEEEAVGAEEGVAGQAAEEHLGGRLVLERRREVAVVEDGHVERAREDGHEQDAVHDLAHGPRLRLLAAHELQHAHEDRRKERVEAPREHPQQHAEDDRDVAQRRRRRQRRQRGLCAAATQRPHPLVQHHCCAPQCVSLTHSRVSCVVFSFLQPAHVDVSERV